MKDAVIVLLMMLALCSVGSGRVGGVIKEFGWAGYPNVAPSINLLELYVAIENSGDESAKFYIEIEIVDGNGRVHGSGCWPTPVLLMVKGRQYAPTQ
jgi:hypothetical protein